MFRLERGERWSSSVVLSEFVATHGVELARLPHGPADRATTSNRAALHEVVDTLKARSRAEVELARDVIMTVFDRG